MSFMSNRLFRMAAAPAMAFAAASLPFAGAVAQERPVAAQPVAANTQSNVIDFCQNSVERTNQCANIASRNKVVVIFWGGTPEMRNEAALAVNELNARGYNTALVYGPDLDNSNVMGRISYRALERDPFNRTFAVGTQYTDTIRPSVIENSQRIFRAAFPQQLASLDRPMQALPH